MAAAPAVGAGAVHHHEMGRRVDATLQAIARHQVKNLVGFIQRPAEWDHDHDVVQPDLAANALQRAAFEHETVKVARTIVAACTTPADHRIVFLGLEAFATDQARVLIRFEVAEADDNR